MQKEVRPTKLKGPISVSHGTVESQKLHKFGNLFHCVPHPYKKSRDNPKSRPNENKFVKRSF